MDSYRQWSENKIGKPELSVVIPTYNEEWRIIPTIGAIASAVSETYANWELIISDDGSTDETVKLVTELPLINMRVVTSVNTGKGGAVRRGVLEAEGDLVLFADADQATPIEQLPAMIKMLEDNNAAVAIGSRSVDGASVANKSAFRELLSKGLQTIVRLGFRLPYQDTQCGFKLFTRDAAKKLFSVQKIDGFSFDLELLYIARKNGLPVVEVPVEWHDAPGSKVSGSRDALRFLGDLPVIRKNSLQGAYVL